MGTLLPILYREQTMIAIRQPGTDGHKIMFRHSQDSMVVN